MHTENSKGIEFPFTKATSAYHHFQQYFNNIMVVSFIGGGEQSNRRKPLTPCKSLTNLIT